MSQPANYSIQEGKLKFEIECSNAADLPSLKNEIYLRTGLPAAGQKLIVKGKEVKDAASMGALVKPGVKILVMKKPGATREEPKIKVGGAADNKGETVEGSQPNGQKDSEAAESETPPKETRTVLLPPKGYIAAKVEESDTSTASIEVCVKQGRDSHFVKCRPMIKEPVEVEEGGVVHQATEADSDPPISIYPSLVDLAEHMSKFCLAGGNVSVDNMRFICKGKELEVTDECRLDSLAGQPTPKLLLLFKENYYIKQEAGLWLKERLTELEGSDNSLTSRIDRLYKRVSHRLITEDTWLRLNDCEGRVEAYLSSVEGGMKSLELIAGKKGADSDADPITVLRGKLEKLRDRCKEIRKMALG